MSLKEIRERHERDDRDFDSVSNNVPELQFRVCHQDRSELLKLVDEVKTILQHYYNHDCFDEIITKRFLSKLD